MMTENAIRDAFEHNDPAKYQDFFNCLHDAAKEKTTAELGTLTRRLLTRCSASATSREDLQMKYDGKIEISWKAASGDITTMAQGREVDMIDALAKSTAAILNDSSLYGLRGKALLNVYIEFLTDLYKKKLPTESTAVKIPLGFTKGGPHE